MLFDLRTDPRELHNLTSEAGAADHIDRVWHRVRERCDPEAITMRILESQRRRRTVTPTLLEQGVSWDHEPRVAASGAYIRNTMALYEIERRSRFPAK